LSFLKGASLKRGDWKEAAPGRETSVMPMYNFVLYTCRKDEEIIISHQTIPPVYLPALLCRLKVHKGAVVENFGFKRSIIPYF
jgi:hypothetical protein